MSAGDLSPAEPLDVIGRPDPRASFEEFVGGSSARLLTMAMLLTGHNRADAENLLQAVLERAFRRWRRICANGDPAPYVRRMLVNAAVDRWRLLRRRPELPVAQIGAWPTAGDQSAALGDRDLLWRALAALPPGQRAVVVLRYYEDLSEAQTAMVLGCSIGSVKTQTARGLARLRDVVGPSVPANPVGGDAEGTGNHGRS